MSARNPYLAPTQHDSQFGTIDPQVLRYVAQKFAQARRQPPTMWGILSRWPGTPLRIILGVFGTLALLWLTERSSGSVPRELPVAFGAMIFGAVLRDLAFARTAARFWGPQSLLIDWQKVEELTA